MFETAGTLTIVELDSSLVALLLLPLLWAAFAAVAAMRGSGARVAMRIAIAASGGTFGLALAHAFRAAQLPPERVAQQHVATLARIGQLDLALDLVRDPTSAACALLVAFLGFAAVLHVIWLAGDVTARLAWIGLATGATLLVVLADGLPALAIGLQLATLAGWGLLGGGRPGALVLALAGDLTVVFTAWLLFWSMGGAFGASGYDLDPQPRFALVALPAATVAEGKATVSISTYEGARVSSDNGPPLPGEPIRSPFSVTLTPGKYSFRIEAGAATSEMLVTHVTLAPGHAYALMPFGPTTSLGNLRDQLVVPRPTRGGSTSTRALLASRSFAGVRVTSVIGLLVVLAALLRLALLGRASRGGLVHSLEAVPPVVLALHVAPLLDVRAAATLALAPALAAVLLAADAASTPSRDRVPRAAVGAIAALAMSAALLGETGGAMVLLVSGALGAAAASAALEAEADVRWLGVACASMAGVLPGAGASLGISSAIAGAFHASAAGSGAGAVVAPLLTIAAMLLSLAVFRVYGTSIHTAGAQGGPRGPRALVALLAITSLLGGAVLGVGTSPFGGAALPLARRLVARPGGLDGVPRLALAALALAVAAAVIGLVAARRATRTPSAPAWVAALGAPTALVAAVGRGAGALLGFFVTSVAVMNEDVIEDATELAANGFAALGRGLRRLDARVGTGLLARALGRGADALVVHAGIDDPARFDRVRTGLVLGMVALLGLVVLSSFVLG